MLFMVKPAFQATAVSPCPAHDPPPTGPRNLRNLCNLRTTLAFKAHAIHRVITDDTPPPVSLPSSLQV